MKKQPTMALSTIEAKYMVVSMTTHEAIWLCSLLDKLDFADPALITVHVDNHTTIKLSKNSHFHTHTKHINIKHHFIQEAI